MASKPPSSCTTFTVIPLDVLSHIALDTVYQSSCPTLRELSTVHALLLTSRVINHKLSLTRNPHLYANIMRLMCDVDPVQRRLGSRATTASALASELPQRFTMLKRVRRRLCDINHGDRRTQLIDLARLIAMMTEDDGKNRRQLVDILCPTGLSELCLALLSRCIQPSEGHPPSPDIAFVVALMWLNSEGISLAVIVSTWSDTVSRFIDAIIREDQEKRNDILDMLQPLVLGNMMDGSSTAEFEYFGLRCALELPSAIPFARLCTVERYDATARMYNPTSRVACTRPPWNWSVRFDDECARYLKVRSLLPAGGRLLSLPHNSTRRLFESNWVGGWYLPQHPVGSSEIFIAYRPMQCQLREYVCTEADTSVTWVDSSHGDEDELARAWFAEGVEFKETMSSLRIYDPMTAQWVSYDPRSQLIETSDVFDTILIGETESVHGAEFGEYKLHGRLRKSDGRIALVRQPANPAMDDLGIWVFHGQIYGRFDLVGEWMNTSTAKDTPSGRGWFRLAKDATDCVA